CDWRRAYRTWNPSVSLLAVPPMKHPHGRLAIHEFLDPPTCDTLVDRLPTIVRVGEPRAVREQQANDPCLLFFRADCSRAPAAGGLHCQVKRCRAAAVFPPRIRA